MIALSDMTSFDVIVALIFFVCIIRGVLIGFMRQVAGFFALIVSYWVAGQYSGQMMPYVGRFIENPKAVFFISFAVLFLLVAVLLLLTGKILHLVMEMSLIGWFDRTLGLILGAFKAFLLCSILYMALRAGLSSSNDLVKKSISSALLSQGAGLVHQVIHDPELRRHFLPKKPAILPEGSTEKVPVEKKNGI